MNLEELRVYTQAMDLGESVWKLVLYWDYFQKDTLGKQLVKAADSVSANISEGYGRYHFKESKQFYYYARGSLYETKTWLTKAHNRQLIPTNEFKQLLSQIEMLGKINNEQLTMNNA